MFDVGWSNVIAAAVLNLTNAIGALYTDGAREVLVANLPNLGQTPALSGSPASFQAYIDIKVALFSNLLAAALTSATQQNGYGGQERPKWILKSGSCISRFSRFGIRPAFRIRAIRVKPLRLASSVSARLRRDEWRFKLPQGGTSKVRDRRDARPTASLRFSCQP
jgi:hypothetical protein